MKKDRHQKAIDSLNKEEELTFKDYLWMSLLIGLGVSLSLLFKW